MSAGAKEARRARRVRWAVRAGYALLTVLARTWRLHVINGEPLRTLRGNGQPVVFAFWHGTMMPLLWQHRHEGVAILISEHGDGEIIAQIAHRLGYRSVRGSTSRKGERAILGTVRELEEGHDVAFTPDGPRGPRESFAPGALIVAHRARAPIAMIGVRASSGWHLKSWDRFLIPKPFARVTIRYADPLFVTAADARDAAGQAGEWQERLRALATSL
jgi:lysophospholipid acyltransferase (LPLAT)-like uncharacterized protein